MISAESGDERYCSQLSNGSAYIQADTTASKGGSGDYFRPHDLLCAAFASCLNITVRMLLEKMGLKYDKVVTKVDLDRSQENQALFLYDIQIVGDIDTRIKEEIVAKALNCPVKNTLSRNITFASMLP